MIPVSKDDFDKMSKAICEKVLAFNSSSHYNEFVENLVKDLCLDCKILSVVSQFHCQLTIFLLCSSATPNAQKGQNSCGIVAFDKVERGES